MESISRAERGVAEISITSLARVCEALGTDLAAFFGKARLPKAKREAVPGAAKQIAWMLRGRTSREARRVVAIVRLALGK